MDKQNMIQNSNTCTSIKLDITKSWPADVTALYDPIKNLGQGRFGTVVLAMKKNSGDKITENEELHAIKTVYSQVASKKELGYFHREIGILSELNHPNIASLINYWDDPTTRVAVMALRYEKGPTLLWLLNHGGKLSLIFCRIVSAQLIEAVAYLHSRAVVHRDIKPDNIIVTFSDKLNDEIWDDTVNHQETGDLVSYRNKWHVTLIDFGFARALTPEDMQKKPPQLKAEVVDITITSSRRKSSSSIMKLSLSKSRRFDRKMSAVGCRLYAAPEILKGVQTHNSSHGKYISNRSVHPIDVTKTLSDHVSFYGMMADAYSVGNTLLYMLTGALPNENVNDMISLENSPILLFGKLICSCVHILRNPSVKKETKRHKYRRAEDIPPEPLRLLKGLTQSDPEKRITVSTARRYPWVDDVVIDYPKYEHDQVDYLSFALK